MLETESRPRNEIEGKPFPCPTCNSPLPVRLSQKENPYCVCNDCEIQLFFRGRTGIQRLQMMLQAVEPVEEDFSSGRMVVSLYNRPGDLKEQKNKLEMKEGLIFQNEALDDAIAALGGEIKGIESEIKNFRKNAEKKK